MMLAVMTRSIKATAPTNLDDRLLDRTEVEVRFGIPKRFLELAVARGDGPKIVRIGRLVRYQVADIKLWIDQQSVDQ